MIKKYWKDGIAMTFLMSLVIAVFAWVPQMYFQQDEWYFMGKYYLFQKDPFIIFRVIGGMHFLPLEQLWFFLQYYFFGLHPVGYGVMSLISHAVVAILAYSVFRMLSFRIFPSVIAVAFFTINPVSAQVVSWPLASICGSVSMIVFLSACIIWIRTLQKQSHIASFCVGALLFCAMLFKEDIVIGYILIPIMTLFFTPKRNISYKPIIISFLLWLSMFMFIVISGSKEHGVQVHKSVSDGISYLTSVPQWMGKIIITHDTLRVVLQRFFGRYTSYLPIIDDDPFIKTVCAVIAGMYFLWYLITTAIGRVSIKKMVLFPCLVIISMTPYFFSISSGLESRHYFIAVFITGMWIAWYLDWLMTKKYTFLFFSSACALGMLIGIFGVANQPREDYLPSQEKRNRVVLEMQKFVTPTSGNVVYYLEHGESLPFLSGVGHMLLVLQAGRDQVFYPYFTNYFLYSIQEEGYQHLGEKGFGYYFNSETLKRDVQKGVFPVSSIRAYSFDRDTLLFQDITKQTLESLYL